MFRGFNNNCHAFGISTVHVTLEGHEGWGDENYYVIGLDPKNVMLNREICFYDFLDHAQEDIFWFVEPDYRIFKLWPELNADCSLLFRENDGVPITPAWRLATKKALPLFRAMRDETMNVKPRPGVGKDWHCDSEAFNSIWRKMGSPCDYTPRTYMGVRIEFRKFGDYIKPNPIYGKNYAWKAKEDLIRAEGL